MPLFSLPTERKLLFWLLVLGGFLVFLSLIKAILLPFVVGILVAYFLDPAADRLERLGLGRTIATASITIVFFSLLALGLVLLVPLLADQISGLIQHLPQYLEELRSFGQTLLARYHIDLNGEAAAPLKEFGGSVLQGAQQFALSLLQSGMVVVNLLSLLLITPVVAFYLLRDWDYFTARVDGLLPRKHAATIRALLAEIDTTIAGFVRGQVNVMLILAVYYAIALSVLALPFGAIIGLLAGMLIILPYIGTLIGTGLALGVAFAQFDEVWRIGAVGGVFALAQIVESNYLTPKLVGEKVGLHPVWVIFGMLAGGTLFGFVGILLAVPVTAVIGVLVRFATQRYLQSELYNDAD